MKTKVNTKKEVELKTLFVDAGVRYWEDATIDGNEDENGDLTPCRKGDRWCPEIDIDSGQITNWEPGVKAEIHFKVCDDGIYTVKDADGNQVFQIDGYVPKCMAPKENGYGDYIIMDINENGIIDGWKFNPSQFNEEDED